MVFPIPWVFHVIPCVLSLLTVFVHLHLVLTSTIRLWPNELVDPFLSKCRWRSAQHALNKAFLNQFIILLSVSSHSLVFHWGSHGYTPSTHGAHNELLYAQRINGMNDIQSWWVHLTLHQVVTLQTLDCRSVVHGLGNKIVKRRRRCPIISINNLQDFKPLCDRWGKQPFRRLKMPIRSAVLGCQEWSSCPDNKKLMSVSNFSLKISHYTISLTFQSMNYV